MAYHQQLGYTVPFTSVHAGKYRTEDKLHRVSKKQLTWIRWGGKWVHLI